MTDYVNSLLLLKLLGIIYHLYYKYKISFHAINIVMDSGILNQVMKEVDSEVIKVKGVAKRKLTLKRCRK